MYLLFESVWTDIVALQPLEASHTIDHRIVSALKHLYLPELLRTQSLRSDLSCLLRQPLDRVDEELASLQGRHIQTFVEHLEPTCALKPHVLIAYAWVFYMALFNGGRWIRAQLLAVKKSSWSINPRAMEAASTSYEGLSFWHFPGDQDGEDIKSEFKARLADIESLLTAQQSQDIVDEACLIFEHCELLVEDLDELIAVTPRPQKPTPWLSTLLKRLVPTGLVGLLYVLVRWVKGSRWYAWTRIRWGGMHQGDGGEEKME